MRGSIVKRGKFYSIVIYLGRHPQTGQKKYQWIAAGSNKREAEVKLAEELDKFNKGSFVAPSKLTLRQFLEQWLKTYAWPNLAPRTAEGYEHILKQHVIPSIGNIKLNDVRPDTLQAYYADRLENGRRDGTGGLSPRTVRHHHVTLHTAMQSAVKWGLLARNPTDAVDAPRFAQREMRVFNETELDDFLEAAKETPYYTFFYLLLYTGARRSEILGLKWADVDLDLSQISINRSLHHLRDGRTVLRPPKTA